MSEEIWKFELNIHAATRIQMPVGAVILGVASQRNHPYLWAKVDLDAELEERRIITYGTGNRIHENLGAFIGTYQLDNGMFVFHVFEAEKKDDQA